MDLAVNKTTAWSVELESTFTSCAEPGEGKHKITKVHEKIESCYYLDVFLSQNTPLPHKSLPSPLPCQGLKLPILYALQLLAISVYR